MKLIWQKVNDWKFWALSNDQEDFYQLLLYNKINSFKGLIYFDQEPFLNLAFPSHQSLKNEAKKLLDPFTYQEFVRELYGPPVTANAQGNHK